MITKPSSVFFTPRGPFTAGEIASAVNGKIVLGNASLKVSDVADIDEYATNSCFVSFLRKKFKHTDVNPKVVLLSEKFFEKNKHIHWPKLWTLIVVPGNILYHWSQAVRLLHNPKDYDQKHWAIIKGHFCKGEETFIHNSATIGEGAVIGKACVIGPYTCIGPGVHIGDECFIGAHSQIICAYLENNVTIGPGARIGQRGFGFIPGNRESLPQDIPQVGYVQLQKGVCVGANSTIDRAALQATYIGEGTRIDNLVHFGHNVQVGRCNIYAAQVGLSGGVKTGDNVHMGGQVGVAGHLDIADNVQLAGKTGILRSITTSNTKWGGIPAQPFQRWMRSIVQQKK